MQRKESLDFAKGIAIILMVVGHCYSTENIILQLIYAFHMPFFFIVSGMLYSDKWQSFENINLLKIAERLLVPYFVFEIVFTVFIAVLGRGENVFSVIIADFYKRIVTGIGVTVTWYLPCILLVYMLFVIINKHIVGKQVKILLIIVLSVIGLSICVSGPLIVLWRAFVGLGFFTIGFFGKKILTFKIKNCIFNIVILIYIWWI